MAGRGGIQRAVGSGIVQVQHLGPHAQVTISVEGEAGPRRVPLQAAIVPVGRRVRSPTRLVRARSGVIPYTARRSLRDALVGWCGSPEAFGVRVLAGGGGTGKTHLAAQLCVDLAAKGWLAGMYAPADAGELDALARAPAPRLVAIDYAETRAEQLAALLPLLAESATRADPVRAVLLVRNAPPSRPGDYLAVLDGYGDALDAIADEASLDVLSDAPLSDAERRELFDVATLRLAQRVGTADRGEDAGGAVDLDAAVFGNPLLVVIAAYLAAFGADRVPSSKAELLDSLIAHEERYWRQVAQARKVTTDEELRRRVVALITLTGAADEDEAASLLRLVPDLGDANEERCRQLARWADAMYGGNAEWRPVEPDLVGERLVATTWHNHDEVIDGALTRSAPSSVTHPLDLLRRAAIDHPGLAATTTEVLRRRLSHLCAQAIDQAGSLTDLDALLGDTTLASGLARAAEAFPPDPAILPDILNALGSKTNLVLRPLAMALTATYLSFVRRQSEGDPVYLPHLAVSLNRFSDRLAEAGRKEEALAASEEAVSVGRRLAETNVIHLAASLTNLSNRLVELGRRKEALVPIEEAVGLYRRLAEGNQTVNVAGLAMSLNNFSACLAVLGRRKEALVAIEETVGLRRRLAEANPTAYVHELAQSLNNLSLRLGDLGRLEEALAPIEEAVGLYRGLAEVNPAAYIHDLATARHNLSLRLLKLIRLDEALASIEEAVAIRRRLAEANPAAHAGDLAMSLNLLTACLATLNKRRKALVVVEEAVAIWRRLVEANPAAYTHHLAMALNNLSLQLVELDRCDEALVAIEEAITINRRLADTNPAVYVPELARSLNNMSNILRRLERGDEADTVAQEVRALFDVC